MYFVADFLNHTKLLENFAGWTRKAYSSSDRKYHTTMRKFLLDFYALDEVFRTIMVEYDEIIAEFENRSERFTLNTDETYIQHPKSMFLIMQADLFLQLLKSLQNSILWLAKYELGVKIRIAAELEDAIKKLDKYGFNDAIIGLFQDYWENCGQFVVNLQQIRDDVIEIVESMKLIVEPNTEIRIEYPKSRLDEMDTTIELPKNIIHFTVLAYNLFRRFIEDLSITLGYQQSIEFERFFPKNLEFNPVDQLEKTLAIYFYRYGTFRGMEVTYNDQLNLRFNPFD